MIECVWPAEAKLGEAPFWSVTEDCLYWVDIDGRRAFRFDPGSGDRQVFVQRHEVGCLVPRRQGGFVAGVDVGLAFIDRDLAGAEVFASPEAGRRTRFNDGKCDRRGRFWVASTDREETEPLAALYRLDAGGLARVVPGLIVGNGMGWSPDDQTMYLTETAAGTIFAFDYDIARGGLSNQRVFAQVPNEHGLPDGLTVDAEGFVWSAHWGGARITRYAPEGTIDRVIALPVPNVTSLAFGGPALDRLYVTTARLGMSAQALAAAPLSGGLFVIDDTGVVGLPETEFDG